MNCNCITETEASILAAQPLKSEGKTLTAARIDTQAKVISAEGRETVENVSCTRISLAIEGRKTAYTTFVLHNFCPFCGVKT